jgi:large subunit ribosomal protein L32
MRHTKGKRNRVRSHHALKKTRFGVCARCGVSARPHTMCANCGYYRGRKVVDVLAKMNKKDRKKKEKELDNESRNKS